MRFDGVDTRHIQYVREVALRRFQFAIVIRYLAATCCPFHHKALALHGAVGPELDLQFVPVVQSVRGCGTAAVMPVTIFQDVIVWSSIT